MKSRSSLPFRYQLVLIGLFTLLGGWYWMFEIGRRSLAEEQAVLSAQTAGWVIETAVQDFQTMLKSRVKEVEILTPRLSAGRAGHGLNWDEQHPFDTLSSEARSEILAFTLWFPQEQGFRPKFFVNFDLCQKKRISPDLVARIQKEKKLDLSAIASRRQLQVFNRTTEDMGRILPVLTVALFAKPVDGSPQGPVLTVDILANSFQERLRRAEGIEVAFLRKDGAIVLHSSPDLMFDYSGKIWHSPLAENLEMATNTPESIQWSDAHGPAGGSRMLAGFPGVIAAARLSQHSKNAALSTFAKRTWLAFVTVYSLMFIFLWWVSRRMDWDIRKLRIAAGQLLRNDKVNFQESKSDPEIAMALESIREAGERLDRLKDEALERGRRESDARLTQTFRSGVQVMPKIEASDIEVLGYRNVASEYSDDFWDAYLEKGRLQVVLGKTSAPGTPSSVLFSVAKAALETLRSNPAVAQQALSMSLGERLSLVNKAVFGALKGKVSLQTCALELDLATGRLSYCNAGQAVMVFRKAGDAQGGSGFAPAAEELVLGQRGSQVGLSEELSLPSQTVQLEPNDTLLVFASSPISQPLGSGEMDIADNLRALFSRTPFTSLGATQREMVETLVAPTGQRESLSFFLIRWKGRAVQSLSEAA